MQLLLWPIGHLNVGIVTTGQDLSDIRYIIAFEYRVPSDVSLSWCPVRCFSFRCSAHSQPAITCLLDRHTLNEAQSRTQLRGRLSQLMPRGQTPWQSSGVTARQLTATEWRSCPALLTRAGNGAAYYSTRRNIRHNTAPLNEALSAQRFILEMDFSKRNVYVFWAVGPHTMPCHDSGWRLSCWHEWPMFDLLITASERSDQCASVLKVHS